MKTKFNKESRNFMIALLLGDGSISSDNSFRMTHCEKQKNYLQWKINKLGEFGIRNCGIKSYVSTQGYKVGETYYYTRLAVNKFTGILKRVFYKPKKIIANRKLLNRIDELGLAIWYMDDGCINHRKDFSIYVRIAVCLSKEDIQIIIDYFKEKWGVNFYTISEGKGTYSLCCGTREAIKFINIIKPYVSEVPYMHYKISYNISGRKSPVDSSESKWKTPYTGEDMIYSPAKVGAAQAVRN